MTTKNATSLTSAPSVAASDVVIIVKGGVYYKTTVDALKQGMATATSEAKGLMSATDKATLDSLNSTVSALATPTSTAIASAGTITVPSGRYHITLSGTTNITAINGLVARKVYTFSYPSGAGLTLMGEAMKAGDVRDLIDE